MASIAQSEECRLSRPPHNMSLVSDCSPRSTKPYFPLETVNSHQTCLEMVERWSVYRLTTSSRYVGQIHILTASTTFRRSRTHGTCQKGLSNALIFCTLHQQLQHFITSSSSEDTFLLHDSWIVLMQLNSSLVAPALSACFYLLTFFSVCISCLWDNTRCTR